jgi:hypothetical protein
MIGPWRDPISGRWIVQKEAPRPPEPRKLENPEQDLLDRIRIDTIWRALQSTAESSQITSNGGSEL